MSDDHNEKDQIMHEIDDQIKVYANAESHPVQGELAQANRAWFYHNWCYRFRELMEHRPLGTVGVLAIPNTTFEDWLYYFWEWARAFQDDYDKFKKAVFDAIYAIEQHLELIDQEIIDIFNDIQDIYNKIKNIENEIIDIYNKIKNIEEEITNIENEIKNINKRMTNVVPSQTIEGTLNAAWKKMDNPQTNFILRWDWIDSQKHEDGMFALLDANWLQSTSTDGTALTHPLGTFPIITDWNGKDFDAWMYAGYVVHFNGMGQTEMLFLHVHKLKSTDNFLTVEIAGTTGKVSTYKDVYVNLGAAAYIYF